MSNKRPMQPLDGKIPPRVNKEDNVVLLLQLLMDFQEVICFISTGIKVI